MTPERFAMLQAKAPKRGGIVGITFDDLVPPEAQKMCMKNIRASRALPAVTAVSKRTKHGAVKTVRHGIRFDSKHEADVYDGLLLRQKAGAIRNLQRQVSFPIAVNGAKVHRVVLDFWYQEAMWYQRADGPRVLVWEVRLADAKSSHTASLPAWKRAKALFEAAYGIIVTVL